MVYDIPDDEVDTDMYQVMEMGRSVLLQEELISTFEIGSSSHSMQHPSPKRAEVVAIED